VQVRRILGIDPGSRITGYGIVDVIISPGKANQVRHVTHGVLTLSKTGGRQGVELEDRLLGIHRGLEAIFKEFRPAIMAIERVFFAKNAVSALKLGQARGAAILSGAIHGLEIVEYSPTEVKMVVTGSGAADKQQVAKMLQLLMGAQTFSTPDASDGLALAVCHAQRLASSGSAKDVIAAAFGKKARRKSVSLAEAVGLGNRPEKKF